MSDGVSFFCSQCAQPMRLDPSLLELGTLPDSLVAPVEVQNRLNANSHSESFVLLPSQDKVPSTPATAHSRTPSSQRQHPDPLEQAAENRGSLSQRLKVASKLFDAASSHADVEHPFCENCFHELSLRLERQLTDVKKERDMYYDYVKTMKNAVGDERLEDKDVAEFAAKEEASLAILKDLEQEWAAVKEELTSLEAELKDLDEAESSYWHDVNALQGQLRDHYSDRQSVTFLFDHATAQLEKLRKTNVLNDAFRIWHEGAFGTINGFRMGRLPNAAVDWAEINAALGQALLLLDVLAKKQKFTFKTYRLVPMGSFSRIEKIDGDKLVLELYGSGGDLTSILFWNRRFDTALVAFLDCIHQLGEYAEGLDPKFRLPYRISKEKIGECSIRIQFNNDEVWTKACK